MLPILSLDIPVRMSYSAATSPAGRDSPRLRLRHAAAGLAVPEVKAPR
jgi:hypothetical protein